METNQISVVDHMEAWLRPSTEEFAIERELDQEEADLEVRMQFERRIQSGRIA